MRKPTDLCLLCHTAQADKTNSHILPRFISTNFLKEPGKARRGYEIGSEYIDGKKPKVIQDSPKEDYILCTDCEHFFSIIEGLAADTFTNWRTHLGNKVFTENQIIAEHLSEVDCGVNNASYSRLLVYSMFWRSSISSHPVFEAYRLDSCLEESLRTNLLAVKGNTRSVVTGKIATTGMALHPYTALTSRDFKDGTANSIAAVSDQVPASLNVDQFGFLLFPDQASITPEIIQPFSNIIATDHKFMVMGQDLWHSVMVERLMKEVVKRGRK